MVDFIRRENIKSLVAHGKSEISNIYHLDRGYSKLEEKLGNCGASLRRIHGKSKDA